MIIINSKKMQWIMKNMIVISIKYLQMNSPSSSSYLPPTPLRQDMTQGQFLSEV